MRADPAWRLDPAVIHLNHGAFGACPTPVLEAQARWRARLEADAVRFMDDELPGVLAAARRTMGAFLRADPEGLAFIPNATTGVSTVLRSLSFRPGDELLATDHEYNATLNALRATAERDGARVVIARIPFPPAGADDIVERIVGAVTPRTRLALLSHVTSPTALVLPVAAIVRELAGRGVETLVDAAHAPGMIPVDVDRLGAAYWTANGHKWLCGPKGSAVLWVREDLRAAIRPLVVSHGANDPRSRDGRASRFRLEFDWPGTIDPSPYLAMADAIDLVAGLEPGGWPAIMAANHAMVAAGGDVVRAALGIEPPVADDLLGAMAALPLPGPRSDDRAAALRVALRRHGIVAPVGAWPVLAAREPGDGPSELLLRLSAQRYNEAADYDRLAAVLPEVLAAAA